ncbi:MAG: hypothetical protein AAF720_13820 [Pseudomonadota bacterium]
MEKNNTSQNRVVFASAFITVTLVSGWAYATSCSALVDGSDFLFTLKAAASCADTFCGLSIF